MPQKVKPDIQAAFQFRRCLRELGQLQNVELHVLAKSKVVGRLQQPKTQVIIRHLREQHMVQKADRDRRLQLQVVLAFVELELVQLGAVIEDAFLVITKSEDLHFDVELPAGLVAGLDVQDRQLVVKGLLGIKGIQQFDVPDV